LPCVLKEQGAKYAAPPGLTQLAMYAGSRAGTPFVPASVALKIWVVVPDDASAKHEVATLSGVS
jgi:hypothetical protein